MSSVLTTQGGSKRNFVDLTNVLIAKTTAANTYFTDGTILDNIVRTNVANTFTENLTVIKNSQTGVAENLQLWRVSDDSSHYLLLWNETATDASFATKWTAFINSTTLSAWNVYGTIEDANDSGTVPVIKYDARTVLNAIATRPLFGLYNRGTSVFFIYPTYFDFTNKELRNFSFGTAYTAKETVTFTKNAQAGSAEEIVRWGVSDNTGSYIALRNWTTTDGQYGSLYLAYLNAGTMPVIAWYGNSTTALDTGAQPIFVFDGRQYSPEAQLTTRPIFEIRNFATMVFRIGAKGDTYNTTIATASAAETLERWTVSDDASSLIEIVNQSSSDGHFSPHLRSRYAGTTTTLPGFILDAQIAAGSDTGSSAVCIFRARRSDLTAITTRPLFEFQNHTAAVLTIFPTYFDFKNQPLRNVSEVKTWQTRKRTGDINGGATTWTSLFVGVWGDGTAVGSPVLARNFLGNGGIFTSMTGTTNGVYAYRSGSISRNERLPRFRIKIGSSRNPSNATSFFFALKTGGNPAAGSPAISTGEAGVAIGWVAGQANFKVWANNADGLAATEIDTGVATMTDTSIGYHLELHFKDQSTLYWRISNNTDSQLAEGTVTTANAKLPTTSHILGLITWMEIIDNTTSYISWFSGDIEQLK